MVRHADGLDGLADVAGGVVVSVMGHGVHRSKVQGLKSEVGARQRRDGGGFLMLLDTGTG